MEQNTIKEVGTLKNKYGVSFTVGDYVYLPLPFYNYGIWKVVKIEDKTSNRRHWRLWVDQGERHVRGFSVDNPFIKLEKEAGASLFENKNFMDYVKNSFKYG